MITTLIKDGVLVLQIDGSRSHLDVKALATLLCSIQGRGMVQGVISGQRVRVVVENVAVEER